MPKWNGYANTRPDEVNHVSLMFHILPKLAFYQVKAELRCIISVYSHALLADLVTYLCSCVMGCASSPFTIHMHRALTSTHWRYLIRATQTFLSTTQGTTQTSTTSTIHHNNFYSSLSPTHPRYCGTCNRANSTVMWVGNSPIGTGIRQVKKSGLKAIFRAQVFLFARIFYNTVTTYKLKYLRFQLTRNENCKEHIDQANVRLDDF